MLFINIITHKNCKDTLKNFKYEKNTSQLRHRQRTNQGM